MIINAAATDAVTLRSLRFNGIVNDATPGLSVINYLSAGSVIVDKCEIFGLSTTEFVPYCRLRPPPVGLSNTSITTLNATTFSTH